ncbi:50S ribosomal protein L6 [Candidatus Woesearchaeota archaeon]|nr:50S ribosomal protein L6 [Candidatus Woesearchaeota archaeon]
MKADVALPSGVTCTVQGNTTVTLRGPKGEVTRQFPHQKISVTVEGNTILISAKNATKSEKTMIGTFESHIKNMLKGVTDGHSYRMKICSGHFPMNVSVAGSEFIIKNFLGEKVPRKLKLRQGVTVKVEGQEVVVEGVFLEQVSQTAADIELLTRIRNRDLRIFQDGIYITNKDGQAVGQL